MTDEPLSLMARLKRHHIFRVASMYAIVAYILIQVANAVFPDIGLSLADVRIIIAGVALLFPVVLVLGWMFIPPSKENPGKFSHWQHLRFRLGAVLTLAIVVLVTLSGIYLWRANKRYMKIEEVVSTKIPTVIPARVADIFLPNSVAVLPFTNLSGDPANQYFSDGISEEILDVLSQVQGLNVIGRASSFQFRDSNLDARGIGQALHVGTLLTGSVQRAGDKVRITAELVNTHSGILLWSQRYDRKFSNLFAIEDDISRAIAGSLQLRLTAAGTGLTSISETKDPEAHRLYLVGLTKLAARGPALHDAVTAFQQAVKLDPNYAQAWGALAETEALFPDYGLGSLQAAYARTLSAAHHALMLNTDVASAYVAQGMVYKNRRQWPEADEAFRHAMILAPGDVEAVNQYAQFLLTVGQFEPALTEIERVQRLDPFSGVIGAVRAYILLVLHYYNEASAQIESTLAAHPDFVIARGNAMAINIAMHRYPEAGTQARLYAELIGIDPDASALLAHGVADPALRGATVQRLETSPAFASLRRDPMSYAKFLATLGARDRAMDMLVRYADQPDSAHPEGLWWPTFDPMRGDPRFKAVLKKMGLPYKPENPTAP